MTYKLDANHSDIVDALLRCGFIVEDNARVERDEPDQLDLWAGLPNPCGGLGIWIYIEIKTPTGIIRPGQQRKIEDCQAAGLPVEVIRTTDEVIEIYHKYLAMMGQNNGH